jgi:hypothetical protein
MLSKWLRQLPYLVHTNSELGLMLKGTKLLAYFMEVVGREPDVCTRYWRMFDRHVAAGRLASSLSHALVFRGWDVAGSSTPCRATSGGLMQCLWS